VPYEMWFLTPERKAVSVEELIDFVAHFGDGHVAALTEGTTKNWQQIGVTRPDGSWAFDIERCAVPGAKRAGAKEIGYFREELKDVEPAINARWVANYLKRIKTIYTFHCEVGFSSTPTFKLVNDIIESFHQDGPGGILYAELEGWTNEDGQHITWEFTNGVRGKWWMALRRKGGWNVFQMQLGNRKHRAAFKAGEVPAGLESETSSD
jgi:hypothetical protein